MSPDSLEVQFAVPDERLDSVQRFIFLGEIILSVFQDLLYDAWHLAEEVRDIFYGGCG